MKEIRLPLIISLAGHAACLGLLLLLLAEPPPAPPEAIANGGIDVVFEARLPRLEAVRPLPSEEATPPVTKMCLVVRATGLHSNTICLLTWHLPR